MQARGQMAAIVLLMAAGSTYVRAESSEKLNKPISDDDIRVVEFQEMEYPAAARAAESEGVVVVRVKLDDTGRVVEAEALSGKDVFVPDSLVNVKNWRFQPNAAKAAVLVYSFSRARGTCKSESRFFMLERPNLATITACWPETKRAKSAAVSPKAMDVMVADKDAEVLDFEELHYPNLALSAGVRGVVVLHANLNDNGEITEATPISGHGVLIPACLANLKNWRFRPNAHRTVVVVYNFRFPCSGIDYAPEQQSQFVFEAPNFATITASPRVVDH